MVKYIIILLDNTSVSFCHYNNKKKEHRLISIDNLKSAILFSMKENLNIQFVYPDYDLPDDYYHIINTIDHINIVPSSLNVNADVVVFENWNELAECAINPEVNYIVRTSMVDLINHKSSIQKVLFSNCRLNVVLTDIENLSDKDFKTYKIFLNSLSDDLQKLYSHGQSPQLNILTDRLVLNNMNNCNAGWESITIGPDGCFYVCPAFYCEKEYSIGSLAEGLVNKNSQLYRLDHAPICRHCDAYHCRRCIWLNKKTTLEVNVPSHEQCVLAHVERNASRELLGKVRKLGDFLPEKEIQEIDYLDPFDKREEW